MGIVICIILWFFYETYELPYTPFYITSLRIPYDFVGVLLLILTILILGGLLIYTLRTKRK